MAIVINGSGTVTGLAVGGLPDGTVDAGTLAANSVDSAELIDGAVDDSHIGALAATKLTGNIASARLASVPAGNLTGTVVDARISALTASKLTGALPSISGASLTNLPGGGKILQVVASHYTTNNNYNGTSFEGSFLTGSITPSATSSKIWFSVNCPVMKNGYDGNVQFKWYRKIGSGSWTEYAVAGYTGDTNSSSWECSWLTSNLLDSPNTTSEVSYKIYIRLSGSGLVYMNSGSGKVGVTLMEVDGS